MDFGARSLNYIDKEDALTTRSGGCAYIFKDCMFEFWGFPKHEKRSGVITLGFTPKNFDKAVSTAFLLGLRYEEAKEIENSEGENFKFLRVFGHGLFVLVKKLLELENSTNL